MFSRALYYLMAATPSVIDTSSLPNSGHKDPTQSAISIVLTIVFSITASISTLMIVIAGFRYVTAHGDSKAVAQARETIIYSVVGLLVSMAAYSIVTFVIGKVG
jgi:hypothetical protein